MTGRGEDLEALEPMLAQKYIHEAQVFRSEPYFLEITPKNVDKAYSLKHLLPILEMCIRDSTKKTGQFFLGYLLLPAVLPQDLAQMDFFHE